MTTTPTKYRIRRWREFQHYHTKGGPPRWIKLYTNTISSADWVVLDDESRVLMIALMMIGSNSDGVFDASPSGLQYIERVGYLNSTPNLQPLIESGFLTACECESRQSLEQVYSKSRASLEQSRIDKNRIETETTPRERAGENCFDEVDEEPAPTKAPRKASPKPKAPKADTESGAKAILTEYRQVKKQDATRGRAAKHLAKIIGEGKHTVDDLMQAVRNYGRECRLSGTEDTYRRGSGNFFGRDQEYLEFLPGAYIESDDDPDRPHIHTLAESIAMGCRPAPETPYDPAIKASMDKVHAGVAAMRRREEAIARGETPDPVEPMTQDEMDATKKCIAEKLAALDEHLTGGIPR